jgi:DNA-binding response OmpR family regulator
MAKAKKKILIIEDEVALVKSLDFALKDNYQVLPAITGKEGLVKAKREKPDLVLLDIILPDVDGLEVLSNLKADKTTDDIPVIVLTNLGDSTTISKILSAGGKEYLIKADWSIADIVKKIQATI